MAKATQIKQVSTRSMTKTAGLPPGTLVHIGKKNSEHVKISVLDYSENSLREEVFSDVDACFQFRDSKSKSWINVDGIHKVDVIEAIGKHYGLHNLMMEDVVNTHSRPKVEEFDNYVFITLKMLGISPDGHEIIMEQVSIALSSTWVISFQEREGDIFDPIRVRLRDETSLIRKNGIDYLVYRLIDTLVDNYFFVTERLSEVIEELEEKVLTDASNQIPRKLQHVKKQLLRLRKTVTPLREAVGSMAKEENAFIKKSTIRYLRDVYEHIIQVNEYIDNQRDILAGIMDLYLSGISNKMNQVMKVLTIISTIFIPLTFIAGIYGMNFDNMPELRMHNGYYIVLGIMLAVVATMVIYFKRKDWW